MRRICVTAVAAVSITGVVGIAPILLGESASTRHAYAVVLYNHQPNFQHEAQAFGRAISRRGYATELVDAQAAAQQHIDINTALRGLLQGDGFPGGTWLSTPDGCQSTSGPQGSSITCSPLKPGDRLLLSLQCDGALNVGVYPTATTHVDSSGFIVPSGGQTLGAHNACWITSSQLLALARTAKSLGVETIVIDSSCSGGASTFLLEQGGFCSISTAPPGSPAVTGDPAFSQYVAAPASSFIRTFADLAVAGGFTILAQFPDRQQQTGFYSTSSGQAGAAMTLRGAIYALEQSLANWNLCTADIYPELYAYEAQRQPAATRARLALRPASECGQAPSTADILKRADNYSEILDRVDQSVETAWAAEDVELGADTRPDGAPAKRRALFTEFRSHEFVTSPLMFATGVSTTGALLRNGGNTHVPLFGSADLPTTIQAAHRTILALIRQVQTNQAILSRNLASLEADPRPTLAAAPLEQIMRAQMSDAEILPRLSKLLGLLEYVEARSASSPCDVGIS